MKIIKIIKEIYKKYIGYTVEDDENPTVIIKNPPYHILEQYHEWEKSMDTSPYHPEGSAKFYDDEFEYKVLQFRADHDQMDINWYRRPIV